MRMARVTRAMSTCNAKSARLVQTRIGGMTRIIISNNTDDMVVFDDTFTVFVDFEKNSGDNAFHARRAIGAIDVIICTSDIVVPECPDTNASFASRLASSIVLLLELVFGILFVSVNE